MQGTKTWLKSPHARYYMCLPSLHYNGAMFWWVCARTTTYTISMRGHSENMTNSCKVPKRTSRLGGIFTFLPIHILDMGPLEYEIVNKLCTPNSKFHKNTTWYPGLRFLTAVLAVDSRVLTRLRLYSWISSEPGASIPIDHNITW